MKMLRLSGVVLLAALALAACDDDNDDDDDQARTPQDQLGSSFAAAFDADSTDDAIDPTRSDLRATALKEDPIDF